MELGREKILTQPKRDAEFGSEVHLKSKTTYYLIICSPMEIYIVAVKILALFLSANHISRLILLKRSTIVLPCLHLFPSI